MLNKFSYGLPILLAASCINAYASQDVTEACGLEGAMCEYLEFSHLPAILDMPCSDTIDQEQVLVYQIHNSANFAFDFDATITGSATDYTAAITDSTCTHISGSQYEVGARTTCTIQVTVTSITCGDLTQGINDLMVPPALHITPDTVTQDPFSSEIVLEVGSENSQIAYIADYHDFGTDADGIWICPIASDGHVVTGMGGCTFFNDDTFDKPIDVILNNDATKAYIANTGNTNIPAPGISICDVDANGDLSNCTLYTNDALDFTYTGLRLNSDNTALIITNSDTNTVGICTVNPDGSLASDCTLADMSHKSSFPSGRVAFDFTGEASYVANYQTSVPSYANFVTVCDDDFDYCYNVTNNNLQWGLGADSNLTWNGSNANYSWLYVANTRTTGSAGSILLCEISLLDGTLSGCGAETDTTFDNGWNNTTPAINLYTNNFNSMAYIPAPETDSIIVCTINSSTGSLSSCANSGTPFTNPMSVWISTFPAL